MIKRHYLIQFWIVLFLIIAILIVRYYEITTRRDAINEHVRAVKAKPAQPIDAIPSLKPVERYSYPETVVRASPFKSGKPVVINQENRPDPNRPREPLEAYPLDALKFAGVLEEGLKRWALIKLPDGSVLRVKVGNYMGKNDGKVIAVTENSLMIEERILDEGSWIKRPVTFRLQVLTQPVTKPGK